MNTTWLPVATSVVATVLSALTLYYGIQRHRKKDREAAQVKLDEQFNEVDERMEVIEHRQIRINDHIVALEKTDERLEKSFVSGIKELKQEVKDSRTDIKELQKIIIESFSNIHSRS